MSSSMWVRPLTTEEVAHISKTEFGKRLLLLDQISIMGRDDSYHLINLDVKKTLRRVHVGDGQYIDDVSGGGKAIGGKKIPILWSSDSHLGYLFQEAKKLNIPIFTQPYDHNIIYFESMYADAFLEIFAYIDRTLRDWYLKRPALVRWFGDSRPDFDSKEGKVIQSNTRNILMRAKNSKGSSA